jgi:serine/threonine protein kinase
MAPSADLPIGSELLGYRIEAVLGVGGMGIVYLARDLRLKRHVALKLLSPSLADDGRFRERLLAESELAASIDHPNIVPIYAAGDAGGRIFISMRYVEGDDLGDMLAQGPLSPAHTLTVVSQIAGALDAAHGRGLVHGDVKPSNVLVARRAGREGDDHVCVADFGLCRRFESAAEYDERHLMGTLAYVAPEQIRGDAVDGRADVYSLGCVLYECLSGVAPFGHRSDLELLFTHLDEDPPSLTSLRPELPPAIDAVIRTALAKEAGDRFDTARALVDAAGVALGLASKSRFRSVAIAAVAALLVLGPL